MNQAQEHSSKPELMIQDSRWKPFQLVPAGSHAPAPRSIQTPEGVADRLRAAAFAEIQARDAFYWASEFFLDAPDDLRRAWVVLARAEQKHLDWLLQRMESMGIDPASRPVSDFLWQSFQQCTTAKQFAHFMANAEERGRRAGIRFYEQLIKSDPVTAEIFRKIAEEELEHIELARRFFPEVVQEVALETVPEVAPEVIKV